MLLQTSAKTFKDLFTVNEDAHVKQYYEMLYTEQQRTEARKFQSDLKKYFTLSMDDNVNVFGFVLAQQEFSDEGLNLRLEINSNELQPLGVGSVLIEIQKSSSAINSFITKLVQDNVEELKKVIISDIEKDKAHSIFERVDLCGHRAYNPTNAESIRRVEQWMMMKKLAAD